MAAVKKLTLGPNQKKALEKELQSRPTERVRKRCQSILLRAEGYSTDEVASMLECNPASVRTWVKQFKAQGISALREKYAWVFTGTTPEYKARIAQEVQKHREELSQAKADWENESDPQKKDEAYKNYLSLLCKEINM